jgi:phospholipase C
VTRGEALVKKVYESIRQSPHWESSVLVITYDEHGGFYDHVPPPATVPPGDFVNPMSNSNGFTFEVLGTRVPTVVVSPWIPDVRAAGDDGRTCNVVDHTEYDHASLLSSVQRLYGLSALTARDAAANDFLHLLSAEKPRDTSRTLPPPADSGFDCDARRATEEAQNSLKPVTPAVRGFVELAAIHEARLEPHARPRNLARAEAVTTMGAAREYLLEVALKLRGAGIDL